MIGDDDEHDDEDVTAVENAEIGVHEYYVHYHAHTCNIGIL